MGCVLSEVITWVTEGPKKLREYRRRRPEEVGKAFATSEDRFHSNGEVLDTVNQLHDELMENRRIHDHVTPTIIQRLIHSSIVKDHRLRASAHQLSDQSSRILGEAQKKLDRGQLSGPAPTPYHTVSDGALDRKKRLPPNWPPHLTSTSSTGTFELETENSNLGQMSGHRIPSKAFPGRDLHSEWVQNRGTQEPVHNPHTGNCELPMSSERSQARYQLPSFPSPRSEHILSHPISSSMQRQQDTRSFVDAAQLAEAWSHNNPLGIIADNHDNTQASYSPLRSRQNRHSATIAGGLAFRPSTHGDISIMPDLRDSDPFVNSGVASSHPLPEIPDRDGQFSSRFRPARNDRPHPHMSVNEGLPIKWAREHGRNARYPDQDLVQTLDAVLRKRDHVCRSKSLSSQPTIHSSLDRADSRRHSLLTTLRVWDIIGIK